ncbi:MAG: glycosyltransferase family 4 protein [Ruminococcaceae bacterium]|nr:glycosyltransferase family 4 protein [Oscillospiraceae bacterium]
MAKKFLLISPKNRPTYNFRGDLLKAIAEKGYEVVATGPDKENVDKIEALGVRHIVVPLSRNGTSIKSDIQYYRALLKVIKEEKPDITLGYTVKPSIYGALAARKAGVKGVYSMIAGLGYTFTSKTFKAKLLHKIVRFLYKRGLKKTDGVFFQNPDDMAEFVSTKLVKAEKCTVVNGSGVNMSRYTPTPYPEKLTFFMLARVMYCKGAMEYLQAAEAVKKAHPQVRFMLLGAVENIQDSVPKETVEDYVNRGVIEYFGETLDVRPYFDQCSVYVLPSYREGTPRTVLEAMSMARPVITSDAPGCRQTVEDGVNGYLVPVKDPKALEEAMLKFVKDPSLVEKMGKESLRLCSEKFEVGKVNGKMLKVMKI